MKKLNSEITQFFQNQGFVIVSTVDKNGTPHNSCKGIVKIDPNGRFYILDLYKANTYHNLRRNPKISITAIDEHKFKGYCLKGRAKIIMRQNLSHKILADWEDKITSRITYRVIKNLRKEEGHPRHPEVLLPKPKYMIVMEVKEIIDLTACHIK